jgi:predicted negative regulator of RcsB-dependent stress response
MLQAPRWLLVVLGAASLGCSPLISVTAKPGNCSEEDVAFVFAWKLFGHAPLLEDDYPRQLCDWDGAVLDAGERRRMGRDTSHYEVGLAWAKRGEPELALAAFRRDFEGATTSSARVADRVEIAKLLSAAGEHEAALRELDACDEELDGTRSGGVDEARVIALVAADRGREAIAVLEARPPTDRWWANAATHMQIGELWLEENEPQRARAAYEAALSHCEENGRGGAHEAYEARVGLARVLWAERRPQQALDALDRLLDELEEKPFWSHEAEAEAWRLRAELMLELDKPWSAAASVRRAFEVEHRYAEPTEINRAAHRAELASLHLRADRPDLAYAGFEAAYRIFARELGPLHERTLIAAHNLGVTCLNLDEPQQAVPWLSLAATGYALNGDAYRCGRAELDLGRAEQRSGVYAEAARAFTVALELLGERDDPRLTDVSRARMYRDATRAFLDADKCDQALEAIERAKEFSARIGEDTSNVDLTGSQTRLEQLRRCWIREEHKTRDPVDAPAPEVGD